MSTIPTTIVVYSQNKTILPLKDLQVAVKHLFQYGVKEIALKADKILVHLVYSPRAESLKRKFGNLPVKYIRLKVDSEQELKVLERLVKKFKFNICDDEVAAVSTSPIIEIEGVPRQKRTITDGASSSSSPLGQTNKRKRQNSEEEFAQCLDEDTTFPNSEDIRAAVAALGSPPVCDTQLEFI